MSIKPQPVQSVSDGPAVPAGTTPVVWRGFAGGLQTQASRPGIQDNEMAWCDGWFPIGDDNLRTVWGLGGALYRAAVAGNIVWYDTVVLGQSAWIVVVLGDGSIVAVSYETGEARQIAGPGTILNPVRGTMGLCAWGSEFCIIVAQQENGYFVWDGVTFYGPGATIAGAPGTVAPAAEFVATIAQADGVGSISGTTLTITQWNFGAFGAGQTLLGVGISGQTISGPQISGTAGQIGTYPVTSGATVTGEEISVAGAVMNVTNVISGVIAVGNFLGDPPTATGTTVTGQTSGSTGGAGQYSVSVPQFVASSTIEVGNFYSGVVPTGLGGSWVETYAGRVWVGDGAAVSYSSPGSLTDNNPQNGAGSFTSSDSFLRTQYVAGRQTNGFLYLIGDSSINYISGVQTSGSPLQTTFTNQNADPEVGTPFGDAVDVFSRNIAFANTWGVHLSYGGSVSKVSDALDGVWTSAPLPMLAQPPSSAKAILFGKKCWVVLVPVVDPFTGQLESKLFLWDSKKWFSSSQDVPLVYIRGLEIGSDLVAFGTDGTSIWQMFANPSAGFAKTAQSKLWMDQGGGLLTTKTANRWWGVANFYSNVSESLTFSIDSDLATYPGTLGGPAAFTVSVPLQAVTWFDNVGAVVAWTGTGGAVTWTASGRVGPFVFAPEGQVSNNGVLLGMTVTTMAADVALVGAAFDGEFFGYRG